MIIPFFQSLENEFQLFQGDSFNLLNELSIQVDMIFADPPYFLSTGFVYYEGGRYKCFDKGDWDKNRSIEEIDDFNYNWLSLCRKLLKEDGTIWVTGTYHNIYSVANQMLKLGYKILNMIVWHKPNAPVTLSDKHFNFSAEYIIWARKSKNTVHYFNNELMTKINGGQRMSDVWSIPTVESWEKHFGKHPAQKPLKLLYRTIQSCTKEGDLVLDPFAGSATTGIAAYLLKRKFIGLERESRYLEQAVKRFTEVANPKNTKIMYDKMAQDSLESMVLVNHARKETYLKFVEKGLCYLRAGDSQGSLLVQSGFERLQYVLLHTNGDNPQLFKLKNKGKFQIWIKESLEKEGFAPQHAPYYIVLFFDPNHPIKLKKDIKLSTGRNTYTTKIKPLSDFIP